MKVLILGYAQHGKDTVAELIAEYTSLILKSSSYIATKLIIFPQLKDEYKYLTIQECYEDRIHHRERWFNLIREYNKEDAAKLAKYVLKKSDIYVGMRSKIELKQSKHLFDLIIWVDATQRIPRESYTSCTVSALNANIIIDNNSTLSELQMNVYNFCKNWLFNFMIIK